MTAYQVHPASRYRPDGTRAIEVPPPPPDVVPLPPSPHPAPPPPYPTTPPAPDAPPDIIDPPLPGQDVPVFDPVAVVRHIPQHEAPPPTRKRATAH